MEVIKIGVYSFNAETLRDKTQKECREMFYRIPVKIVDEAYKKANPKKVTKRKG